MLTGERMGIAAMLFLGALAGAIHLADFITWQARRR
jgi:hypothetical protein